MIQGGTTHAAHELTDAPWETIKDLSPSEDGDLGRTADDNRLFVNAAGFVWLAAFVSEVI